MDDEGVEIDGETFDIDPGSHGFVSEVAPAWSDADAWSNEVDLWE
jgi:hypothetical protein